MLAHVEPSPATPIAMLVGCLVLVFSFEATNGFHGTDANTMRPTPGTIWSGLMKFVGILASGIAVACALIELLPPDVLSPPDDFLAVTMLVALFASACFIATWWFGIPTSSSYCIIGAPGGAASATFMCVFVAAPGDKSASSLGSMGLSALSCVFGVLLFHFVLQIPMPALEFGGWSLL